MTDEEMKEAMGEADCLEEAIDRFTIKLPAGEEYIPVPIVKQLLDHFNPKWRERKDKFYKYWKFATEQQLDKGLNEIRNYVDIKEKGVIQQMQKMQEFIDEFEAQAAEVKRIIEMDRIVMARFKLQKKWEAEGK